MPFPGYHVRHARREGIAGGSWQWACSTGGAAGGPFRPSLSAIYRAGDGKAGGSRYRQCVGPVAATVQVPSSSAVRYLPGRGWEGRGRSSAMTGDVVRGRRGALGRHPPGIYRAGDGTAGGDDENQERLAGQSAVTRCRCELGEGGILPVRRAWLGVSIGVRMGCPGGVRESHRVYRHGRCPSAPDDGQQQGVYLW